MTDIRNVRAILNGAKNSAEASEMTPRQLEAFRQLWFAVEELANIVAAI